MPAPSIYSIKESHPNWPALLREVPEKAKPAQLYIRGRLPEADTLIVAIVGTRHPSAYGKDAAEAIASLLARRRVIIASGMAIGIDTIAHRSALKEGVPTLAVLGCGLEESVLYPKENIELSRAIWRSDGALLSEYPPAQKPELWTFPQRNRIIAGIAKAVIVIEAGAKSGALITARFATEYGREVLALPGPITQAHSQGTNALIKQGATPITKPEDVLEAIGIPEETIRAAPFAGTPEEESVLAALDEALGIDDIIKKTRLPSETVLAAATTLEIAGAIKNIGGGIYRRIIS